MSFQIKGTPDQLKLIKAMASSNRQEAIAAREIFAQLLAPVVGNIFLQADTTSMLYKDMPFALGSDPSFPLEPFLNFTEDEVSVWSQALPGGLATNTVYRPIQEIKFTTYELFSAISWLEQYAKETRLPIISRYIEFLVNVVLIKNQRNAWNVVMAALANATHNGRGHVFSSATAGTFSLNDFNKIITYFRRLNKSFVGGTPIGGASKPTDMIISPEIMEIFRGYAFQPINTKVTNALTPTAITDAASGGGVVTLPDDERAALFNGAGAPEFFGITLTELLELGKTQPYQYLFSNYFGATTLPFVDPLTNPSGTFNPATNELILVVDSSKDYAWRAIQTDADTGSVFSLESDDQFYAKRSGKIGLWGACRVGHLVIDTRSLAGYVV